MPKPLRIQTKSILLLHVDKCTTLGRATEQAQVYTHGTNISFRKQRVGGCIT